MNIEQLKNQIKDKINQIEKLDLSKLYPTSSNVGPWNNMTNSETEKFVKGIISSLKELKNNLNLLDFIGFNHVQTIDTHLTNFINQFSSVQNLNDEQITTHHHDPLNQLNGLSNILRNSALYTELRLDSKLKEKN